MAGAALWGLGTALGFPVGMSAASDDPRHAAGRVSVVATVGYVAFLAGPPLIGFLADDVGTLRALTATGGLVALGLLVSGALRPLPVPERAPAGRAGGRAALRRKLDGTHEGPDARAASSTSPRTRISRRTSRGRRS